MLDRSRRSRPPALDEAACAFLEEALEQGPQAYGLAGYHLEHPRPAGAGAAGARHHGLLSDNENYRRRQLKLPVMAVKHKRVGCDLRVAFFSQGGGRHEERRRGIAIEQATVAEDVIIVTGNSN